MFQPNPKEDQMSNVNIGRRRRVLSPLIAGLVVAVAALGLAAPALAGKPTGNWANFTQCPLGNHPSVELCIFAETTSGEFKIGSTAVPLEKRITLQGGTYEESGKVKFVNAANGETLSKTPQTVPGGLLKIMSPEFFPEPLKKIFNEFIDKGITGVTATTEQVGEIALNFENEISGKGVALILPVRVHLENSFLGNSCYVGSKAHPITVELITGTTSPPLPNKPITGSLGELEALESGLLLRLKKNSLVNNTFSAPSAEGCGSQILFGLFTGLIDGAVGAEVGLPSESGHNTAILNGTQEVGAAEGVRASE
jgi:hypothetical protein